MEVMEIRKPTPVPMEDIDEPRRISALYRLVVFNLTSMVPENWLQSVALQKLPWHRQHMSGCLVLLAFRAGQFLCEFDRIDNVHQGEFIPVFTPIS